MENIIVQVQPSTSQWQYMTATVAPSNVVLQGSSDIYVVESLNALKDSPGTTITLAEADKEILDKMFADGVQTAVFMDRGGNLSVRYELISAGYLLIVFLVSNGQGQTYIVGYQYDHNVCRCIIKYKLADIGENDTMLTAQNWEQYITLPSAGGSEWTKTEDMSDINLYNAKELYVKLTVEGYQTFCYPLYIYCPDGLGTNTYYFYYLTTYFGQNLEATGIYYNGTNLACNNGTYSFREVWYKL